MKMLTMVCCLAALAGLAAAAAAQGDGSSQAAGVRVGTFDSRAVALAYYRSEANMEHIRRLKSEYQAALAAGDQERADELQAEGESTQALAHKQGFGTWPVDDILARIADEIPAIAQRAGVDVIVSKWDIVHAAPGVGLVDVTLAMVAPFDPDKATLKLIRDELPKVDPVPLEELTEHEH